MPVTNIKNAWVAFRDRLSARHDQIDAVHELYAAVVEQARQPLFYRELGVPDRLDGRFDLIVLHLFFVLRKLGEDGRTRQGHEKQLLGLFFSDMDRSLREMGVGDLSVGKKIRNMAEAYYGRAAAYEEALAAPEGAALERALERNIYAGEAPQNALPQLAAYVRHLSTVLDAAPQESIAVGHGLGACFEAALHHLTSHGTA